MGKKIFNYASAVASGAETDKRSGLPINLTPRAREVVENIRRDTGVAKQEAVARVLEWFSRQSERVQSAILHGRGDAAAELAAEKMADLAAARDGTAMVSPEQARDVIKLMTDRLAQIDEARLREIDNLRQRLERGSDRQ